MGSAVRTFDQPVITDEIGRIVAKAVEEHKILSASTAAAQVIATYPNCGLSERDMGDEIALAAAKAGIAVELGSGQPREGMAARMRSATRIRSIR